MNKFLLSGLASSLLCATASVSAKMPPELAVDPILPYIPSSSYDANGRWNGPLPVTRYGLSVPVLGGNPETQASGFLQSLGSSMQLPSQLEFRHRSTRSTRAGHNVHFDQYLLGTQVYNGRTVVHISPQAQVTQLALGPVLGLLPALSPALLDAAAAESAAISTLNAQGPFRLLRSEEVIYPTANGSHRAWMVHLIAQQPIGDWEVLVDARTGAILARWDRSAYASQGSVFDPDPLSSSQTVYGQPIVDADDSNYPEIAAQVMTKDLGTLNTLNGLTLLSSPYAEIVDSEAPFLGLFAQSSPDFIASRDADLFEASNVFWHTHDSMAYINEVLGIPLRPYQYEGGVRFDPHGLNGDDNSHYNTGSGEMAFGEGCVDDSEDGDVIRHELGHGIHDWITDGGLSNIIDGLSEGFGDYWAHSYSRSLGHWQPDTEEYHWVFNWDGHNECWGGRITNYNLPWPVGITPYPAIHGGGQIFSTCMMQVYDDLGRTATDTIVLEGLAMTTTISSQNDAANAIWQAAADLGFPAEDLDYLNTQLSSCGYIMAAPLGIDLPPPLSPDPASPPQSPSRGEATPASSTAGGALGGLYLLLPGLLTLRRRLRPARGGC